MPALDVLDQFPPMRFVVLLMNVLSVGFVDLSMLGAA
jgi:hypothetical protein